MKIIAVSLSILILTSSLSAQGLETDNKIHDSTTEETSVDSVISIDITEVSSAKNGSSPADSFYLFWGISYISPAEKADFIPGYCNENIKPIWQVGDITLFYRHGYIQACLSTGFLLSVLYGDSYGYESSTYYAYYEFDPSFMMHIGSSVSACFPVSEHFSLFGGVGGKIGFIDYDVRKSSDYNTLDEGDTRDYRKYFNDIYLTCGIVVTPFSGSGISLLAGYDRSVYSGFVKTDSFRLSVGWKF